MTHEMGFARRVADTMVFMDHGEIVESAEPERFFRDPETEIVAATSCRRSCTTSMAVWRTLGSAGILARARLPASTVSGPSPRLPRRCRGEEGSPPGPDRARRNARAPGKKHARPRRAWRVLPVGARASHPLGP